MLNEISRALTSRLDLHDVYDTIYEQISRVMDTSMFFLALATKDNQAHLPYIREYGDLSKDVSPPAGRSVTTHVFEMGQPLLFHTSEQYELYAIGHGLPVIILGDESQGSSESMMYAPLNTGSKTIGTLSVQSTRQYAYSTDDLDTLTVITSQAAIAIQNGSLYEAMREAALRRQTLIRLAETVNSSLELPSVLGAILKSINDVMPYHLAAIMLPNHKAKVLDTVGAVGGMSEERWREMKVPFGTGITGMCFEKGEAVNIADVHTFPGYIVGSEDVRAEVAVPLKRDKTIVGVLNVERSEAGAFSEDDVQMLSLFATQAAIAIENARLFEDQRDRVVEMQAIQDLVQEMTGLHENEPMAALIERGLRNLIDLDECIVFLVNHQNGMVEPVLPEDSDKRVNRVPRSPRRVGDGAPGWIAKTERSTIFPSTKTDTRISTDIRSQDFDMAVLGAPLMHQGRVSGVILVCKDAAAAESFDENALRRLEIIAAHAAIGFDRCRLYQELHLQATTDELTGIFNRRYLSDRLKEEQSRALRNNHQLAALMLDADGFKRVNDKYGHDAGDLVLRELATLIRGQLRTEDIVSRYGGEEFLVLLPEVDLEAAVSVADRLCTLIATRRLPKEAGVKHMQVSIGIASLEPDDTGDEIITRADLAMYEAKRNGGNRVCVSHNGAYVLIDEDRASRRKSQAA